METERRISLHRGYDDVEQVMTSYALPRSDAQKASNVELLEDPSFDNSLQSSSTVIARNNKRSTSRAKFLIRLWARFTSSFIDWWMGELLAILLSVIAFFGIIVILCKYDGHTLPRLPYNVPLSFVVSTLATVSKSSLLLAVTSAIGQFKWLWMSSKQRRLQDLQVFDEASRGPLGAAKLLLSRKGLSWAAIGAIVTILCLIFDPFIQALISISEQVVYSDDPATLVKRMETYPTLSNNNELLISDYQLMNTINDAIINSNPLSETQPHCPTGNCTWPLFTSLGFCFKCEDISQPLRNGFTSVDLPSNLSEYQECLDSSSYNDDATCSIPQRNYTYRLPELNGQILKTSTYGGNGSDFPRSFSMISDISKIPAFFVISLLMDWDSNETVFNFTDGTLVPMPALVALIRTSLHDDDDSGGIIAADVCALSFCAQKRNVSISLGQPSFTVIQTVYGTPHVPPDSDTADTGWLSFIGDSLNITYHPHITGANLANPLFNWQEGLRELVQSFAGNMTALNQTMYGSAGSYTVSNIIIDGFNASSDIPMTMDNIATALTNYFRDSSNNTVTGKAGKSEFYIHVNWPWITLPALLVIAGTTFLLLAMFETKRRGARVWKTSELALLFHGLEKSDQDLNVLHQSSEMEHMASGIRVKMAKTLSGGWILRREGTPIKSI